MLKFRLKLKEFKIRNAKFYNIALISVFLCLLIFIMGINYFIDPLDVFHTKNIFNISKTCVNKNQRLSKIPAFKLNKEIVDAVWIGSSKTGECTNKAYENYLIKGNFVNMAINGGSFEEAYNMAKNVILIHPEIKRIYFGVDFHEMRVRYTEEPNNIQLIKNKNLTREELLPLLLSYKMLEFSFTTISRNLNVNNWKLLNNDLKITAFTENDEKTLKTPLNIYEQNIEDNFHQMIYAYDKFYTNYKLDNHKFEQLRELIFFAKSKNVEIIIFGTSMHVSERYVIKNTNNLENFDNFKRELVKIQPYYDFAIIDKYTTEDIKPDMKYFMDSGHAYPNLRTKMTSQIIKHDEDFGKYLTEENVENSIKTDDLSFEKYYESHKSLMSKIIDWSKNAI